MRSIDSVIPYVRYVVDDAGSGRPIGADIHAIVRKSGERFRYASRIVGFQGCDEPMVVAVHSYLDVPINDADAEAMAVDYLEEIGWFEDHSSEHTADFIL